MKVAARLYFGRDRDIDLLFLIAVLQLRFPSLLFHLVEVVQHPVLEKVYVLTKIGLLFLGNAAHLFHQRIDFAHLAIQILLAKLIDAAGVCAVFGFFQELGPDLFKPVHDISF